MVGSYIFLMKYTSIITPLLFNALLLLSFLVIRTSDDDDDDDDNGGDEEISTNYKWICMGDLKKKVNKQCVLVTE